MTELHERIKAVRKSLRPKVSQAVFAQMLGTTRRAITTYETGVVVPSDTFIQLLCTKFNINEEWLRTGKGAMRKDDLDARVDTLAQQYILTNEEREVMRYFFQLTPEERKALIRHITSLAETIRTAESLANKKDGEASAPIAPTFSYGNMDDFAFDLGDDNPPASTHADPSARDSDSPSADDATDHIHSTEKNAEKSKDAVTSIAAVWGDVPDNTNLAHSLASSIHFIHPSLKLTEDQYEDIRIAIIDPFINSLDGVTYSNDLPYYLDDDEKNLAISVKWMVSVAEELIALYQKNIAAELSLVEQFKGLVYGIEIQLCANFTDILERIQANIAAKQKNSNYAYVGY